MRVLKFGGSSLADAERILAAAHIIARHRREVPTAVVVSAMAGVTDALLRAGADALAGRPTWCSLLSAVEQRHRDAYQQIQGHVPPHHEHQWRALRAEAEALAAAGASLLPEIAEIRREAFSAWGERLITGVVAAALGAIDVPAEAIPGEPVLLEHEANAREHPRPSVLATRAWLAPRLARLLLRGGIPVLPGYIARDGAGRTTTLGRNGSDVSAAALAAALGANALTIYSDVAGVYSADPHYVLDARLIPLLTYSEAREIAALGAKVLHPRTVEPLAHWRIPLHLRSSLAPDAGGSEIVPDETPAIDTGFRWCVAVKPRGGDPATVEVSGLLLLPQTAEVSGALRATLLRDVALAVTKRHGAILRVTDRIVSVEAQAGTAIEMQRTLHTALELALLALPGFTKGWLARPQAVAL